MLLRVVFLSEESERLKRDLEQQTRDLEKQELELEKQKTDLEKGYEQQLKDLERQKEGLEKQRQDIEREETDGERLEAAKKEHETTLKKDAEEEEAARAHHARACEEDEEMEEDEAEETSEEGQPLAFKVFAGLLLVIPIVVIWSMLGSLELSFPQMGSDASFALLLLAGFLTGFHCVGMCGGFMLSSTGKAKSYGPVLQYGGGKLLSYTFFGGLFGLLGSFIAFTSEMRAGAAVLAGIFLVIFGIRMLGIFKSLRAFSIRTPESVERVIEKARGRGPFFAGLLNGLMIACGPLQAMYVLAAGSGSPVWGAAALFFFGLGTLPPMLGFGAFMATAGKKFEHAIFKLSGVLVLVMGLLMLNNGLVLAGSDYSFQALTQNAGGTQAGITAAAGIATVQTAQNNAQAAALPSVQKIYMKVTRNGWEPNTFTLVKGVPVEWTVEGVQVTGCNNEIVVPDYNLKIKVTPGKQVVKFTPTKAGIVRWSCWMGMIPGAFKIVDAPAQTQGIPNQQNQQIAANAGPGAAGANAPIPTPDSDLQQAVARPAGGCGCGGGSGSCH